MKFRKKPVIVEAVQITKDMVLNGTLPDGTRLTAAQYHKGRQEVTTFRGKVQTLEGDMEFSIGDWIITGIAGEKYPCKPDIFEKTYEPVEEPVIRNGFGEKV